MFLFLNFQGIWLSASKLNLATHTDTPGCQEMQTVSPENILETKPKRPGSDNDPDNSSQLGKSASASQNFPFHPHLSKSGIGGDILSGNSIFGTLEENSHHSVNHNSSSDAKVLQNNCIGSVTIVDSNSTPQVRNVRVNIVNPASKYTQHTPNTVSYFIPEGSYLCPQTARNMTGLQYRSGDLIKPVPNFSVGSIKLEKLKIYGQVTENTDGKQGGFDETCISGSRNKRKRYLPFRSPLLNRTNENEEGRELQAPVVKKTKLEHTDLPLGRTTKAVDIDLYGSVSINNLLTTMSTLCISL